MLKTAIVLLVAFHLTFAKSRLRIAGGRNSTMGQFPYQVFIGIFNDNDGFSSCSGGLLNSRYIITAAHCLHGIDAITDIRVLHGIVDLPSDITRSSGIEVKNWKQHPNYTPQGQYNDIALLEVPINIVESSTVQYLSLATTVPVTGTKVMVAGWGVTPESSIGSERLQYVEYATAADFICSQFMGAQFDGKKMICASEGIKGPCAGDSGGPVVYKTNVNDTHYTAIGLVSFGLAESCGETSIDVFTKIPTYLRWISENMPENSILVTTEPGPTSPQQKLVAPGPIIIATLQRYLFTGGITLVLGGLILVAAVVGLTIALCVMASEKRRIAHNAATEMAVYNRMYN